MMPDFGLPMSLDDLDVKRALIMTDNTLGETCTDEIAEEAEPNSASANQGSPKLGHANDISASSSDITPKSGHADDSGISTNDSPEKDQYANEPGKLTSMNRMSRSSLQDELKSRLGSIKEKQAPQPPVPVPRVKSRENSREKAGSLERKTSLPVQLEKSQTETPSGDDKTEIQNGDKKSSFKAAKKEETDKKASFKESLERKLTSRKSVGSQDEPSSKGRRM